MFDRAIGDDVDQTKLFASEAKNSKSVGHD
jgi:hypothetical protein